MAEPASAAAGEPGRSQGRAVSADAVVIGGGVAGLWTLHRLLEAGADAVLLERAGLGAGQTRASQGILHAGVKYRLPGNAADSSRVVAVVQPVWAECLAGERAPDLSSAAELSPSTCFWTLPGLGARAAAETAARVMRSEVRRLGPGERPAFLAGAPRGVEVFEADERVLDPGSVVAALSRACGDRGFAIGNVASAERANGRWRLELEATGGAARVSLSAAAVVLAAGEGNEALLPLFGADAGLMQRRPLHMLIGRGAPVDVFGHCLEASSVPRLTVTTGRLGGERCRYVGGGVAERGVGLEPAGLIERARAEFARCTPWLELSDVRWETLRVDRAEGREPGRKRPDGPVVVGAGPGLVAAWPTKLVLAPALAERAAALVAGAIGTTGGGGDAARALGGVLERAGPAGPLWSSSAGGGVGGRLGERSGA